MRDAMAGLVPALGLLACPAVCLVGIASRWILWRGLMLASRSPRGIAPCAAHR
jgi:hypothetical protein